MYYSASPCCFCLTDTILHFLLDDDASRRCSIEKYKEFKQEQKCILIVTDLIYPDIDIECVDIVINYDISVSTMVLHGVDTYFHRVGLLRRAPKSAVAYYIATSWVYLQPYLPLLFVLRRN